MVEEWKDTGDRLDEEVSQGTLDDAGDRIEYRVVGNSYHRLSEIIHLFFCLEIMVA